MPAENIRENLVNQKYDSLLLSLYSDEKNLSYQKNRYLKAVDEFISAFGNKDISIFSTSGRVEIIGNHTDHQQGKVMAAAITQDAVAVVSAGKNTINIISDDKVLKPIQINDLEKRNDETNTSEALVRGVCFKLKQLGYKVEGFNAFITSDVPIGSGISSSACFEVLVATIISGLYNEEKISSLQLAEVAQYAENVYFEKPCGLMDQCAVACGGIIGIDFKNPEKPEIEKIEINPVSFLFSFCLVDTRGSHADLTDEYSAITAEMKQIAAYYGKNVLREINEEDFYCDILVLRKQFSDRAILRAHHFFDEEKRVDKLISALKANDIPEALKIISASGNSSYKYLQNVYSPKNSRQDLSLALAISEKLLDRHGVSRVHGGGFSGTILAVVENSYVDTYCTEMEKIFGKNSCRVLKIRQQPSIKVI